MARPDSRSSRVSPTHSMGVILWRSTASSFALTSSSVSPKYSAALRVPDDHVADVQLFEHPCAHLARERPLVLVVAVLLTERNGHRVGLESGLHRAKRGERRVQRHRPVGRQGRCAEVGGEFRTNSIAS